MTTDIPKLTPTSEQMGVIESSAKRILVEANAGAAKTTTAALKIKNLVNQGLSPSKIVALSFSEPGVKAYANAFRKLGMPESITSELKIGTVEEFCIARLKKIESAEVHIFRQLRDIKPYVLEAIQSARNVASFKYSDDFLIQGTGILSVEHLLKKFSFLKGTLGIQRYGEYFRCNPSVANDLDCDYTSLAVFIQYEKSRASYDPDAGRVTNYRYNGDATYDMAINLLSDTPPWDFNKHPFQLNLQAIILDEMHDCSWSIFTVIKELLAWNPNALFLGVGDRDQVIHGTHGADSYFMSANLDKELGSITRLPLSLTHRFGEKISLPLSSFSRKKYPSCSKDMTRVSLRIAADANTNVGLVSELIHISKGASLPASDNFAVLLRHPGASVELEHGLSLKGLSYQTVGFKTFLQRPEIAFIRMVLSVAINHETHFIPEALLEAKRAIWLFFDADLPPPDTKLATANMIENASEVNFKTFMFHILLGQTERDIASHVHAAIDIASSNDPLKMGEFVNALNFTKMAQKAYVSQRDIDEAIFSINSFSNVAKHYNTIDSWLSAMNSIDQQRRRSTSARNRLRLSTIEEAKGLEFSGVFIPDCNIGNFDGNSQDERNLFYVAASRARDHLMISYKKGFESSFVKPFINAN